MGADRTPASCRTNGMRSRRFALARGMDRDSRAVSTGETEGESSTLSHSSTTLKGCCLSSLRAARELATFSPPAALGGRGASGMRGGAAAPPRCAPPADGSAPRTTTGDDEVAAGHIADSTLQEHIERPGTSMHGTTTATAALPAADGAATGAGNPPRDESSSCPKPCVVTRWAPSSVHATLSTCDFVCTATIDEPSCGEARVV